jgi:hypothetical protein
MDSQLASQRPRTLLSIDSLRFITAYSSILDEPKPSYVRRMYIGRKRHLRLLVLVGGNSRPTARKLNELIGIGMLYGGKIKDLLGTGTPHTPPQKRISFTGRNKALFESS